MRVRLLLACLLFLQGCASESVVDRATVAPSVSATGLQRAWAADRIVSESRVFRRPRFVLDLRRRHEGEVVYSALWRQFLHGQWGQRPNVSAAPGFLFGPEQREFVLALKVRDEKPIRLERCRTEGGVELPFETRGTYQEGPESHLRARVKLSEDLLQQIVEQDLAEPYRPYAFVLVGPDQRYDCVLPRFGVQHMIEGVLGGESPDDFYPGFPVPSPTLEEIAAALQASERGALMRVF